MFGPEQPSGLAPSKEGCLSLVGHWNFTTVNMHSKGHFNHQRQTYWHCHVTFCAMAMFSNLPAFTVESLKSRRLSSELLPVLIWKD